MSLASDYAARQAQVDSDRVTANQSQPPTLEGPNAILSVDVSGALLISPKSSSGPLLIPPTQAITVANWIIATFS